MGYNNSIEDFGNHFDMDHIKLNLAYRWQPVFLREKVEYLFPMAISPFMRAKYRAPAVFKWEVYQTIPGDRKIIYIGEAQELCPQRLYGYLSPSASQLANQKINAEFRVCLKDNFKIKLDICQLEKLDWNEKVMGQEALKDRDFRRFLVSLLIVQHKQTNYDVRDL
jgi:hypothetical protein